VYWHPRLKKWTVSVTVFVGAFESQDAAGACRRRIDLATERIAAFVRKIAHVGG
jgi:hypothetical protein